MRNKRSLTEQAIFSDETVLSDKTIRSDKTVSSEQSVQDNIELAEDAIEGKLKQRVRFSFPWLSMLTASILIGFLIWSSSPELQQRYLIEESFYSLNAKLLYTAIFFVILLFDIRFYLSSRARLIAKISELKNYLSRVWKSKKAQQRKANTFSGHTDKLKNFISDKLLEFVEYDAKFLHFKGIAAEVRHNGVISYDKVITALYRAMEQQKFLSIYEQNKGEDGEPSEQTIDSLANYQNAIYAMRYLWDLLDLSTADNMAIHIGNQLIECEEHYYQLHLDSDKKLEVTQSIPVSPTFHPQLAALMTISLLSNDTEIRNLISLAGINEAVLKERFIFENEQLRIDLSDTPELLGNPNHIILLLENLIKNAQFFSQKCRYKQSTDRIVICLRAGEGFAHYTIYNRGPHIEDDIISQIFKLGYSTRRSKQHHGKGLGLFFSQEIVNGYQGAIEVSNVGEPDTRYKILVTLASGENRTHVLSCRRQEDKMQVCLEGTEQWNAEFSMTHDIPVTNIQVVASHSNQIYQTDIADPKAPCEWLEPSVFLPAWRIQTKSNRRQSEFVFKPLDTNGVRFDIKLPTAESCLNEQVLDFDQVHDPEIADSQQDTNLEDK